MDRMIFEYVPEDQLLDGEVYLVDMKHGLIEGCYSQKEQIFQGYYWSDLEFYGAAYKKV